MMPGNGEAALAKLGTMFGAQDSETFLGLPKCPDLSKLAAGIVVIGADCATPYASVGAYCAGGPVAIRAAGAAYSANRDHMNFDLGEPIGASGRAIVDAGDLALDPLQPEKNRRTIRAAMKQILDQGAVPVLLGGDDSVPLPMIEAFGGRNKRYTILQIDAHIDWRDEVGGERLGLSSTMRRASEMAHVGRIVQVGQRGIGSARVADVEDAKAWGVEFVSAREVAAVGIGPVADLIEPGAEVIICLDLDALDPSIMPAVIGRTAGGLSYWQVLELITSVAGKAKIVAVDMVEFMPERDIDGQGALVAAQLLAAVLGVVARN